MGNLIFYLRKRILFGDTNRIKILKLTLTNFKGVVNRYDSCYICYNILLHWKL